MYLCNRMRLIFHLIPLNGQLFLISLSNMLKKLIFLTVVLASILPAQNDVNNRFMLAASYEQAGEFEKAKNILEDLFAKQPDNFQFFDALNRIYIQLKNYDSSEKIIKQRISITPQDMNLYGLLGKTYHIKGDEQLAFDTWDDAIVKSNYNLIVYRLIVNYAMERRAFGKAIELLNDAKQRSPDSKIYSYDLANLYALTMNYTRAAEEFVSVLKSAPNEIHNVRGRMNTYLNKPEALKQTIGVFEGAKNTNIETKSVLAWLFTEDKNFTSAYELYKELDKERGSGGGEIFGFAQLLFNAGEFEIASGVFLDILNGYSSSPLVNSAKMGYARSVEEVLNRKSFSSSGRWKPVSPRTEINIPEADRLIEIYIELSKKTASPDITNEALFRAGNIYLNYKNRPGEAEKIYTKILEYPMSLFAAPAAVELGKLYIGDGRLEQAMQILGRTSGLPRATEEQRNKAKFLMSQILFYNKEFDEAGKLLSQILRNLRDNSANDALELSLILNIKMNDSLSLVAFSEAEYLLAQGKFSEAGSRYGSISAEKGGFVIGSLAALRSAETELALNNTDNAMKILTEISGEESGNIYSDKALYLLGNIYEYSLRDSAGAVEIYEKLLARFPASMYLDDAREHIIDLRNKLS